MKKALIIIGTIIFIIGLTTLALKKYSWRLIFTIYSQCLQNKKSNLPQYYPNSFRLLNSYLTLLKEGQVLNNNVKEKNIIPKFTFYTHAPIEAALLFKEIFIRHDYYFKTNKKNPFIIDGGSNMGMSVLYFKTLYPNSKILAFEPSKLNFKFLKKNIVKNKLVNIKLVQKAVLDEKKEIYLYSAGTTGGTICHSPAKQKNAEKIKATILSKYINEQVDLLKLDIEGSELKVLEELNNKNKFTLINEIILEYHSCKDNSFKRLVTILKNNNFECKIDGKIIDNLEKEPGCIILHAYKNNS